MLERIRRNRKLILWILLALIVPPFIFFGIESAFVGKKDPVVGILFDKKIRLSDFYKAKTSTLAILNLRQPNRPMDGLLLDQLTWQRLILLHQVQQLGLEISNDQLSKSIIQNFSQSDFDHKSYELFVRQVLKLSVFEFENAYRDTLLIEKFQDLLSELIQITEDETYEAYLYENEKLEISYCEIPSDRFLNAVNVSDEELKNYFEKHVESFRIGIQRKVSYFSIPLKTFEKDIALSQKEVEDYYRNHRKDFKEPLDKIYQKVKDKLKNEKIKASAYKKARKIYRAISKGMSFKKVSEKFGVTFQHSDFFSENQSIPLWKDENNLSKRIFENELKEPLDPFLHNQFFYIVVPVREKPSRLPEFDDVKSKIHDYMLEEKARESSKIEAENIKTKINETMKLEKLSFEQACQKQNEQAIKIPLFSRQETELVQDGLGEIKRAAWHLSISQISDIQPTLKGYGFFIVMQILQPTSKAFEEQKDFFKEKTLSRKRQKFFYEYYDWLLKQCQFFRSIQGGS